MPRIKEANIARACMNELFAYAKKSLNFEKGDMLDVSVENNNLTEDIYPQEYYHWRMIFLRIRPRNCMNQISNSDEAVDLLDCLSHFNFVTVLKGFSNSHRIINLSN